MSGASEATGGERGGATHKRGRASEILSDLHATLSMSLHESLSTAKAAAICELVKASEGGDGPCLSCGSTYPAWRAPHDLWNLVVGGADATDDPGGLLCPNCFLKLADLAAPVRGAWVIGPPEQTHTTVPATPPADDRAADGLGGGSSE